MQFNYTTSILNIALMAIHAFMMLTAAVLIFIKHNNPNDRSKSFVFAFFLTSAIVAAGEVMNLLGQSNMRQIQMMIRHFHFLRMIGIPHR